MPYFIGREYLMNRQRVAGQQKGYKKKNSIHSGQDKIEKGSPIAHASTSSAFRTFGMFARISDAIMDRLPSASAAA